MSSIDEAIRATMQEIGEDEVTGRKLLVLDLRGPRDIPPSLDLQGCFICLLAWDADRATDAEVQRVVSILRDAGCVYICCWGADCERVHDLFDETDLARSPDGPFAMSTWHADDPLEEALWFALYNAHPDPAFAESCRATLAVSIGCTDWAAAMGLAMADLPTFNRNVVES